VRVLDGVDKLLLPRLRVGKEVAVQKLRSLMMSEKSMNELLMGIQSPERVIMMSWRRWSRR